MPTETYEDAINILRASAAKDFPDNQLMVDTCLAVASFLEAKKQEIISADKK